MTWARNTQEPCVGVRMLVFLPNQPTPERSAAARSFIGAVVHEVAGSDGATGQVGEFADEPAQPGLDDAVVVASPGVAGDFAPGFLGIGWRRACVVVGCHGDDGARAFEQQFGAVHAVDALLRVPGEAVHEAAFDALGGGFFVALEGGGVGDAHAVEAESEGEGFDFGFEVQVFHWPYIVGRRWWIPAKAGMTRHFSAG